MSRSRFLLVLPLLSCAALICSCGSNLLPSNPGNSSGTPVPSPTALPFKNQFTVTADALAIASNAAGTTLYVSSGYYAGNGASSPVTEVAYYTSAGVSLGGWSTFASDALVGPLGLAADPYNNLVYATDWSNDAFYIFTRTGGADVGPITGYQGTGFNTPVGIAVSPGGNLYLCDLNNHEFEEFTSLGQAVTEWPMAAPWAVAVSPLSPYNVYVTDVFNDLVDEFSATGTLLNAWGGSGAGMGKFSDPEGVAVDGQGHVFVADYANNLIQEFGPSGQFLVQWGNGASGGKGSFQAVAIAADQAGDVYILDRPDSLVQVFGP